MIYEIKRNNIVIFQHEIKGRRTRSAPAVDFVDIEFDYYEAIDLKKNDTIVYKGDTYYCDKQTVNIVKKSSNLYSHRAKFLGENYKATEIALLDPELETHIFEIEGNLLTLVTLAVRNLNRVDSGWSYDTTDFPDTITKLFKISDENVMSFIAKLSGEFEMPFVIKDKVIKFLPNLSTEYAGDLSYGRGNGFLNLTKSYKNNKVANTIYASGGEDFQLSHSVTYEPHILENGVIEGFYSNERIFPTTRTQITGVVTQNNVVTTNLISYNLEDYLIQGQRAIVNFETGSLAGLSFFAENVEKIAGVTLIYLQRRTIDGVEYPNNSARPTNSDFFNITNITMPEEIVEEASIKLRDYAVNFLMRSILSNMVIQGEVDPLVINNLQLNDSINITDVDLNLDNQAFYVTETVEHFQDLQKLEIKLEIYIEDNPNLLNLNLDIVNENIIDLQIGSNYDLLVGISDRVIVGDDKNIIKPGFSLIDLTGNNYIFDRASIKIGSELGFESSFGSIGASWGKASLSANPDIDSAIKLPQTGSLLPKTLTTSYTFNKTTYDADDSGSIDLTPISNAINNIPLANNGSINYVGVGDIVGGGVSNANQSISTSYQFDLTAETKNNIAKAVTALQPEDLDGFIYDVQYNSTTHTITFYQQNEPNIVIDLPIEQLIKGVQLVGNDLVFTFEDGSTVTVPLNTLLVGVVKKVNGLTPNSQGEIILNVTDIPNLSSALDGKANAGGNNLTNIGTWQSNLNVLTTNTNQTGLTGNKTSSGNWQVGSLRIEPSNSSSLFEQPILELSDLGTANGNIIPIAFSFGSSYNPNTFIKVYSRGNSNVDGGDFQFWSKDINHTTISNGGILTTNQFRKAGQTDSSILLAGGGHRPVSDFALAGSLGDYLPLTGGTLTGNLSISAGNTDKYITFDYNGTNTYNWRIGYLGTGSGNANYFTIQSSKSTGGVYFDALRLELDTLNAHFLGTVTAPTFIGALSGNASTATTLATARTINGTSFNGSANITTARWGTARNITIGNTTKSVNGSANVSWSLAEIGAASQSSLANYLPLTGGTLSGEVSIVKNGQAGANTRFLTLRDTDYSTNQGRVDIAMLATNTNTGTSRGAVISMRRTNNLGALHFEVADNNLLSLIGHSQNVGVSVETPTEKLDVNGNIRVRALTSAGFVKTSANGTLSVDTNDYALSSQLSGYVPTSRTLTAGNGLSGGGTLAANRTITLGTPSSIGLSTTNSVTSTSHTHSLDAATITAINNGQTAFGWGNHALVGYLTTTALNNYYQSGDVNIPAKGGDYVVFPETVSGQLANFDFDTITTTGFYNKLFNAGAASTYNAPKTGYYGHVEVSNHGGNILQITRPYRVSDGMWMRNRFSGNWTPWVEFIHSGNLSSYANSLLTDFVPTSRTITINGVTQNLSANRTWTVPDTITRLRGTTSGTYTSGDLTLLAGANTTITQSGSNITIASTNTTYSAGTLALLQAGTNTTNRVWSASILGQRFNEILKRVSYYNDGDNVDTSVNWGTNVIAGTRNQIQGARNIVKGEDINIFGSRNMSSGINNQINGFANVANGAFNTINGAYSSIAGSQANIIGNYLFARDKQTVLGMYNKVYDLGQDEGLRFAFGTGDNDFDKFNAVEIYEDHRTEFHGRATYNEETRNPEWFGEDYTHVDTYHVGYDHLEHRAEYNTPCEHGILALAVRNNTMEPNERFVNVNNFDLAFDVHGIVDGNFVENNINMFRVHTKGTLYFSDVVRTQLFDKARIHNNPYLIVDYNFGKGQILVRYVDAFYIQNAKKNSDTIIHLIGSFINRRGTGGQPNTLYFEFNQQII